MAQAAGIVGSAGRFVSPAPQAPVLASLPLIASLPVATSLPVAAGPSPPAPLLPSVAVTPLPPSPPVAPLLAPVPVAPSLPSPCAEAPSEEGDPLDEHAPTTNAKPPAAQRTPATPSAREPVRHDIVGSAARMSVHSSGAGPRFGLTFGGLRIAWFTIRATAMSCLAPPDGCIQRNFPSGTLDGTKRATGHVEDQVDRPLRTMLVVTGALGLIASPGCRGKVQPPAVCSAPQGSSSAVQSLATDDTAFALAFYPPALAAAGSGGNVILSPYSVSATMTMLDVGAAGQTESQIESVLRLPSSATVVAPAYAALACGEETDGASGGNELLIANSLWAQQTLPFEKAFETTLETGYSAPLQQVDFEGDPSGAVTSINAWVSGETQGEIPSLLQPGDVTQQTRIVLVDAVYFKGAWASAFDPSQTGPRPFTLSDGSQVSATTMNGTINLRTGRSQTLTVVELPYRGGSLAMDFVMPAAPDGLAAFEATLTPVVLGAALAMLESTQLPLYLPKFSFTTRLALVPVLSGMGMTDVFVRGEADLSGVDGAMDLSVSAVVQQALVEVDEQGTVAAAATAASGCGDCGGSAVIEPLYIDQPFLFLIRDTESGGILFMGHVTDPRG